MTDRAASRVGAIIVVFAIAILVAIVPRRIHFMPSWAAYAGVAAMVLPMLFGAVIKDTPRTRGIERIAEFTAVGAALFFNCCNLIVAAYNLIERPGEIEPLPLFYTSIGIWTGNVLIFALLYWLIDRGGPDDRLMGRCKYPDFVFPAMEDEVYVPKDWKPHTIDYVFLAFTTSTAFSPTEAMPMTSRAKVLVMIQSAIALITIAIVAARTINILK